MRGGLFRELRVSCAVVPHGSLTFLLESEVLLESDFLLGSE